MYVVVGYPILKPAVNDKKGVEAVQSVDQVSCSGSAFPIEFEEPLQ